MLNFSLIITRKMKSTAASITFWLLTLASFPTFADFYATLNFDCPRLTDDAGEVILKNNGVIIFGYGKETLDGKLIPSPLFVGSTSPGVPLDLVAGRYFRASTFYSSEFSTIDCLYASTINPPFKITYNIKKGAGGEVVASSLSSIKIRYVWGFNK